MSEFIGFPKIARLSREMWITEKINGTNACVFIPEDGSMAGFKCGSRSRWITPEDDNYGFAKWCYAHLDELMQLGVGRHFGEWWGQGIQCKYGLDHKRFSLFNAYRWCAHDAVPLEFPTGEPGVVIKQTPAPACCHVVPVLYRGVFDLGVVDECLQNLVRGGSVAAPSFMKPEGVVVYHTAANVYFKKTIERDEVPKSHGGK